MPGKHWPCIGVSCARVALASPLRKPITKVSRRRKDGGDSSLSREVWQMPGSRFCALLVLSVVLASRCASSVWLGAPASVTLDQIVAKFNELESKSINLDRSKAHTNEEGDLAGGKDD